MANTVVLIIYVTSVYSSSHVLNHRIMSICDGPQVLDILSISGQHLSVTKCMSRGPFHSQFLIGYYVRFSFTHFYSLSCGCTIFTPISLFHWRRNMCEFFTLWDRLTIISRILPYCTCVNMPCSGVFHVDVHYCFHLVVKEKRKEARY